VGLLELWNSPSSSVRLGVVIENSVRAENAKISSACQHSLLEKLIEVSVQQRCNGVLNRKAWSAEKNPVSARDEIALVHKTNGSYRRRGPTNSKRRGVGIDDGVLRPEESLRCARVLASPRVVTENSVRAENAEVPIIREILVRSR
jgi:hypothetical protein